MCVIVSIFLSLTTFPLVGGSWECGDDWFEWISRTKGEMEPTDRETFQEQWCHFSCTFSVKQLSGIYLSSSSLKTGTERGCGIQGLARSERPNGYFGE